VSAHSPVSSAVVVPKLPLNGGLTKINYVGEHAIHRRHNPGRCLDRHGRTMRGSEDRDYLMQGGHWIVCQIETVKATFGCENGLRLEPNLRATVVVASSQRALQERAVPSTNQSQLPSTRGRGSLSEVKSGALSSIERKCALTRNPRKSIFQNSDDRASMAFEND
jgi:hypothetical protein